MDSVSEENVADLLNQKQETETQITALEKRTVKDMWLEDWRDWREYIFKYHYIIVNNTKHALSL